MHTCSVCRVRRECHVLTIENGEGAVYGVPDGEEFYYCKPCWRILQDKRAAASILQGLTAETLQRTKHHNPQEAAAKFYEFLMTHGTNK